MPHKFIKICGLMSVPLIEQTAAAGADYIGLVFHPLSKRYVTPDVAVSLANAINTTNAKAVAVFANHTASEMQTICERTKINIVQLHGDTARAQHAMLPDHYQRFFVQPVTSEGKSLAVTGLEALEIHRDVILVDHMDAGKGKRIDWQHFHYDMPFPWLLAGGLNPENVESAIQQLNPHGVDVSSGVELDGQKNIVLIKKFIQAVRG